MEPTIKSIEGDVYKLNRDRVIIGMANFIAGIQMGRYLMSYFNFSKIKKREIKNKKLPKARIYKAYTIRVFGLAFQIFRQNTTNQESVFGLQQVVPVTRFVHTRSSPFPSHLFFFDLY